MREAVAETKSFNSQKSFKRHGTVKIDPNDALQALTRVQDEIRSKEIKRKQRLDKQFSLKQQSTLELTKRTSERNMT